MNFYCLTAAICACLLSGSSLFAQSVGDTTVGGGLSVFGATLETTYHIESDSRLRGVLMGGLRYDEVQIDDDGNRFDVDIDLAAAALLLDYYPDRFGWRVSGGLLMNLSDLNATGQGGPNDPFEINGQLFTGGTVMVESRFSNEVAPMITAGYDYDLGNNWIMSGELGAIYIGGIETELTASSDALQNAIDSDEDFQNNIRDLEDTNVLPYLSVAVSFRF